MSAKLFTCSELKQNIFFIDKKDLDNSKDSDSVMVLKKHYSKSKKAKGLSNENVSKFAIKSGSNIVKLITPQDFHEFMDKYLPKHKDDITLNEIFSNASKDLDGVYISSVVVHHCRIFEEDYVKEFGETFGVRVLNKDILQDYTGPDMERESLRKVTLSSEQKRCLADFEDRYLQAEVNENLASTTSEFVPMNESENWLSQLITEGTAEREARGEAPPTITIGGVEIGGTNTTTSTVDTANTTISTVDTANTSTTQKEFNLGRRATSRIAEFMNKSGELFSKFGIRFDNNVNSFGSSMRERKENMMKSLNTLKKNIIKSFSDFSYQITKRWDDLGTSINSIKNPFTRSARTKVNNQTGPVNLNIFNFSSTDVAEDITNQIKNSILTEEKKLIHVANFQSANASVNIENAALSLFITKDNQVFLGNLQLAGLND